jgi:hypothetical protein
MAIHEAEGRVIIAESDGNRSFVAALPSQTRLDLGGSEVRETVLDFILGE